MIIHNFNLDDLDRKEYIAFLQTLIDYYYVLFTEEITMKIGE